ncbi:hypothetical protein ACXIZN_16105 [Amycolatopsis sp. TRM77291]
MASSAATGDHNVGQREQIRQFDTDESESQVGRREFGEVTLPRVPAASPRRPWKYRGDQLVTLSGTPSAAGDIRRQQSTIETLHAERVDRPVGLTFQDF